MFFFRESAHRRKLIPNCPLLCKTRWTHKYRSIRVFGEHFTEIVRQLENLAETGNAKTKQTAYQLLCASSTSVFVLCLLIIQIYSSKLEPVTQKLQAVQLDLLAAQFAIKDLLVAIREDRKNCDDRYNNIFSYQKRGRRDWN